MDRTAIQLNAEFKAKQQLAVDFYLSIYLSMNACTQKPLMTSLSLPSVHLLQAPPTTSHPCDLCKSFNLKPV